MGRAADEDVQTSLRSGTVWVGIASGLSGVLDLVTTLACLWLWVSPAELGVATMASALFPVVERIATLGLPSAAVRSAEAGARVLSTIFWLNLASAFAVLVLAIAIAPAIGAGFGYPIVGLLICAYAGKLVGQTIQLVPEARLKHALEFDTLSKLKIGACIAEASAKLVTAYFGGHGHPDLRIWCFVVGPIASTLVMMVGTQLARPWRPALVFDRAEAKAAAKFGIHLSLADLVYFAYTSADYVVIGSVFGAAAVGVYRLAYELVLDVVRLVSMVTAEVAFPAFTRLAGNSRAVGEQLIALTRQNLSLVAPLLVVIGVAAGDLLAILYPPLGADATRAAQILCAVGALRSISFVLPAMLAGLGHARDALVYNIVAAIVCPSAFALAAWAWPEAGYLSVAWAWAASYPIAFALLVYLALSRSRMRLATYARGLWPVVAWASVTTAAAIVAHASLPAQAWPRAIGVASVTAASYGAFWWWTRRLATR